MANERQIFERLGVSPNRARELLAIYKTVDVAVKKIVRSHEDEDEIEAANRKKRVVLAASVEGRRLMTTRQLNQAITAASIVLDKFAGNLVAANAPPQQGTQSGSAGSDVVTAAQSQAASTAATNATVVAPNPTSSTVMPAAKSGGQGGSGLSKALNTLQQITASSGKGGGATEIAAQQLAIKINKLQTLSPTVAQHMPAGIYNQLEQNAVQELTGIMNELKSGLNDTLGMKQGEEKESKEIISERNQNKWDSVDKISAEQEASEQPQPPGGPAAEQTEPAPPGGPSLATEPEPTEPAGTAPSAATSDDAGSTPSGTSGPSR